MSGTSARPSPASEGGALANLPQSAQTVFQTLQENGPLTHKDLLQTTGMPGRTVRYAVSRLKKVGLIDARCNLMDCRQCYFFLTRECAGDDRRFLQTPWKTN